MTVFDWTMVALVALSVLQGLRKGLILTVTGIACLLAGVTVAAWYAPVLAAQMARWIRSPWEREIFSFLMLLLAVMLIAHLFGKAVRRGVRTVGLGWADRFFGAVFGLVRGVIFLGIVFVVMSLFFPANSLLRTSRLAPFAAPAAQGFLATLHDAPAAQHPVRRRFGKQWQ